MGSLPESIENTDRLALSRQFHAVIGHFDNCEFESAITLAAAAEGILPSTQKHHFFKSLKNKLTDVNLLINWLKHGVNPYDTATISEIEVAATIFRSITKFDAVYGELTPEMKKFIVWAKHRVPDL